MARAPRLLFLCFLVCSVFLSVIPLFASDFGMMRGGFLGTPAPPRLIYPITDKVDLSGKTVLTFKWWGHFGGIDHYEWRLFRGYNMVAADLIDKQILPARVSSFDVKADVFENGQVYSWSLIAVAYGGEKSDKSMSSFRVTKAQGA